MVRSKVGSALLGSLIPNRLRSMTSVASDASSVVTEMIDYSRKNFKGNHEQVLDILKAGHNLHQTGPQAGRIYLAKAEIEEDKSKWDEVARLARNAATAASEAQPSTSEEALLIAEVELAAVLLGTRAFLAHNQDAEAFSLAQQCMEVARKSSTTPAAQLKRRQGLILASATAAMVQHAAGDFDAASDSFDAVVALLNQQEAGHLAGEALPSESSIATALKQTALFRLAQGNVEDATALAARAVAGAKRGIGEGEGSTAPLQSPITAKEALADSYLASAQVLMQSKQWEEAEAKLSSALATAESVSGEAHPRVALVLSLLGSLYSRTGRVTLAEGLYRESCKMLGIYPEGTSDSLNITTIHSSVAAMLTWRYTQLLTALPSRGTEAAKWQKLARDFYDDAPVGRVLSPEACFGTLDNLQGKGREGYGVVVDLMMRRALPKVPRPEATSESSV